MPLSSHSVGTYQETSSQATHQGTLGHMCLSSLSHPGLKSGITVQELISTYFFLKGGFGGQVGNEWSNLFKKILASKEKRHH